MSGTPLRPTSALVIDDQADVREYLKAVLETVGITSVATASGMREAIATVTEPGARFDLIVCDLQMPEADGVETLRALAALGQQAWVVVLSVEPIRIIETVGMLAEAQGLHVLGAIQKPLTVQALEDLLARTPDVPVAPATEHVLAPEGDLANALLRGELRLFYQPKVHMRTRQFVAVEALVRWQHPTLGLFPPGAFVPMIEKSTDLTSLLNDYAMQAAIDCAGRWLAGGREVHVAINLSASAFDRLDLPERIEVLTRKAGIPNELVTLEVTETQVARDPIHMSEVATRLRLKRFSLSVDDFGTGQSGLSQLRKLPFNELKIDRQFVDGCARSATKRSVVEASLALARDLGMTAVAEGIEQQADWDLLDSLGCDVAQGYYVARPMSEQGLEQWLPQWTARHG